MRHAHADFFKLIGIRVRELRGGESQESVCNRAGVSRRVLAGIEAGTRDFQITSLLRILTALDADLPSILGVKDSETRQRFQAEIVCKQVFELIALGGMVELMITNAVRQWHKVLIESHSSLRSNDQGK